MITTSIRKFDSQVAKLVARLPSQLTKPFHYLGVAFVPLSWMILLALFAFTTKSRNPLQPAVLVIILLPLASLSKLLFRRQRPPTIYAGGMRIKSYSFPSSHAYAAVLGGGYIANVLIRDGLGGVSAGLLLLAAIIGISRVYLGAHYPSDVIGGWVIGATVLWAILLVI